MQELSTERRRTRVLIVDDELGVVHVLSRLLQYRDYQCATAMNATDARRMLGEAPGFEVMLCDVNMPGESGLELIRDIPRLSPDTAVVMVTGSDDPALADVALQHGAYGYVIKPFEVNEILINVANALRRRTLELENRQHRQELERLLSERTGELRQAVLRLSELSDHLRVSQEETIHRLARAAEFRHNETAEHVQRMSRYSAMLGRRLGLPLEECELLRVASALHDVGKIGIPDSILLKPGPLTGREYELMREHAVIGYRILSGSRSDLLNLAATIAHTHHEKVDGTGYPRGLKGTEIPLEGRVAAVADVFDALTSRRVYRPALSLDEALQVMKAGRGKHFDPRLLDLFIDSLDEVLAIREEWADRSNGGKVRSLLEMEESDR